ncbi:MAG: NADPH-dependent assimilatory sulfite reductase hemoprotein subunit [Phycisphaerales bacterium]
MSEQRKLEPLGRKGKPTKVEVAKENSRYLRGTILPVLNNPQARGFEHDDVQLLKFHGIYQGEDRDARAASKVTGIETDTWFMIRMKSPGGILTADQYLAMDRIADEVTHNHSLRVTTRQNFQLHGVLKTSLKAAIKRAREVLLDSLCGCGDVERNVMASPAPLSDAAHVAMRELTLKLSNELCPRTNAYVEIWYDGEKVDTTQESEPLYQETYLPRKFKTAVALPDDNSVDLHSQDVGLLAIVKDGKLIGANVLVGGGFGMTHKKEETIVRLGSELGFVPADQLVNACRTIVAMFRDYGDRTDRKHARLKYVVQEYGMDAFREEFEHRIGFKVGGWVETSPLKHQDWLGKHEQGDGKFFYGVWVPNGRIIDEPMRRYKTAFRQIVRTLKASVILTPNQNVLFGGLSEEDVVKLERIMDAYNLPRVTDMTAIRRHAMACVALPTCSQALTEAERVFDVIVEQFERELEPMGLTGEEITIRITGCPNGCARPYSADIGLVGHKPGHYDIYLGGRIEGDRLAEFYSENVPMEELAAAIRPLLTLWAGERMPDESFGDFYQRKFCGGQWRTLLTGSKDNPARERVEAALAAV